jgi:hypothetical protein
MQHIPQTKEKHGLHVGLISMKACRYKMWNQPIFLFKIKLITNQKIGYSKKNNQSIKK